MTDELVSLIKSSDKVVGTKQVIKAIMDGTLRCVIVSDDADGYMVDKVEKAAKSANVKVYHTASMVELEHYIVYIHFHFVTSYFYYSYQTYFYQIPSEKHKEMMLQKKANNSVYVFYRQYLLNIFYHNERKIQIFQYRLWGVNH